MQHEDIINMMREDFKNGILTVVCEKSAIPFAICVLGNIDLDEAEGFGESNLASVGIFPECKDSYLVTGKNANPSWAGGMLNSIRDLRDTYVINWMEISNIIDILKYENPEDIADMFAEGRLFVEFIDDAATSADVIDLLAGRIEQRGVGTTKWVEHDYGDNRKYLTSIAGVNKKNGDMRIAFVDTSSELRGPFLNSCSVPYVYSCHTCNHPDAVVPARYILNAIKSVEVNESLAEELMEVLG